LQLCQDYLDVADGDDGDGDDDDSDAADMVDAISSFFLSLYLHDFAILPFDLVFLFTFFAVFSLSL
jgi:hypothetical protein